MELETKNEIINLINDCSNEQLLLFLLEMLKEYKDLGVS